MLAAGAELTIGMDGDMAELAGKALGAPHEPVIADDPRRHAGAEHDDEQVMYSSAEAEPLLGQAGCADIVLERDGKAEPVCHGRGERRLTQSEIGGVPDDTRVGVNQPRGAQADGCGTGTDETIGGPHDGGNNRFRPFRGGGGQSQGLLGHPLRVEPRGLDGGAAEVDGDNIGGAAHQYP